MVINESKEDRIGKCMTQGNEWIVNNEKLRSGSTRPIQVQELGPQQRRFFGRNEGIKGENFELKKIFMKTSLSGGLKKVKIFQDF